MALSYWIETMLTLSSPAGSKTPGRLAKQVGVEHLFPIVPPFNEVSFETGTVAARALGFPVYMFVRYRLRFGYMVPGAFQLTLVDGGINSYNGTITGYSLEEGLDILNFVEPDTTTIAYITNLTPLNQYFEMTSQFLIITSENDYKEFKNQLETLHFPYKMPELYPGVV